MTPDQAQAFFEKEEQALMKTLGTDFRGYHIFPHLFETQPSDVIEAMAMAFGSCTCCARHAIDRPFGLPSSSLPPSPSHPSEDGGTFCRCSCRHKARHFFKAAAASDLLLE